MRSLREKSNILFRSQRLCQNLNGSKICLLGSTDWLPQWLANKRECYSPLSRTFSFCLSDNFADVLLSHPTQPTKFLAASLGLPQMSHVQPISSTFKSLSFAIGSLLASKPAFCIICWTFPVCPSYVYFKFPMTGTQESNFASVPCVFGAIFQDACPYISWLKLHCCFNTYSSWVAQWLKKKEKEKKFHLPVQEMQVQSLYWEDFLEKEMAIHSSILAWKAPWTEEPGGLQSTESQKSQTWLSGWTHIHRYT